MVVLVATVPQEILSGLKPSTLKQLGQTVPTTTTIQVKTRPSILKTQSDSDEVKFLHSLHPLLQDSSVSADRSKHVTSTPDTGVNVLSLVPFRHTVSCFVSKPCAFYGKFVSLWFLFCLCDRFFFFACFRIWGYPQHEAEAAVRTRPVTTCIRTATNLLCVQNVAPS